MPKRDMLINNVPGEECRIAIIEDGKLEELYHERHSVESHVGSIFKGRVVNVEPAIQAAFIDFGLERNGFLHITDLHPRYFPGQHKEETERVGYKTPHRERPPIQKCLKRGQEILVQVIKEGIGTKGPTVTSYLSIPGRFLVMMPAMERLGVSRKVDDDEQRREMKRILDELNPPAEFGFIIRTAGMGRPKTDLKRDLAYLLRLWKNLEKQMESTRIGELYTESDLMIRTIRDVYSTDIDRIIVDEPTAAKRASDFLAIASPRAKSNVLYYDDPVPLFHRYGVEAQIETIHARRVPLPGGGSLVIDSTEALVAIDVNSGKMRNSGDAETTAYRTNVEACDEVCRQLRLRDLGGVVVIDLIDMRSAAKRRAIEQRFRDNLKNDRARTKPLAISQFGILEMTRQRMRPSLNKSVYSDCHYCHGEGTIKNIDAVVLDVMRRLSLIVCRKEVQKLAVTVSPDVAFPLLNRKRGELVQLETKFNVPIQVRVNPSGSVDFIEILPMDDRGNALTIDGLKNMPAPNLQAVESMPVDDEFVDEELAELESRATKAEEADESHDHEEETAEHDEEAREGHSDAQSDADSEPVEPSEDVEIEEVVAAAEDHGGGEPVETDASPQGDGQQQQGEGEGGGRRRRRRRRRGRGRGGEGDQQHDGPQHGGQQGQGQRPQPQQHGQGQRPQQGQQGQQGQRPQHQQKPNRPPQQQQGQHDRPVPGQRAQPQERKESVSRGYTRGEGKPRREEEVVHRPEPGNEKELPTQEPDYDGQPPFVDGGEDPGHDQGEGGQDSQQEQPVEYGPDGQPIRRRRRRRGGRRHRRRRERERMMREQQGGAPNNGNGQPPQEGAQHDGPHGGEQNEDSPSDGPHREEQPQGDRFDEQPAMPTGDARNEQYADSEGDSDKGSDWDGRSDAAEESEEVEAVIDAEDRADEPAPRPVEEPEPVAVEAEPQAPAEPEPAPQAEAAPTRRKPTRSRPKKVWGGAASEAGPAKKTSRARATRPRRKPPKSKGG